jgi:imidazolonepropionase-like amidohydrolase
LYGSVKKGMIANLILLDENPLENMANIRQLNLVFKNGKAYDPKLIKQEYGWSIK